MFIPLIHRRFAHLTIERGFYAFELGPVWMFLARLDPGDGWALYGNFNKRRFVRFFGVKRDAVNKWVL